MTEVSDDTPELTGIPDKPTVTILPPEKTTRKQRSDMNKAIHDETQITERLAVQADEKAVEGHVVARGVGRPSSYTPDMADEIISRLAMGQSLRTVCKQDHLPVAQTIFSWMRTRPEFLERYQQAKREAADMMAEDIMDISDDGQNDYMEVTYGDQSVLRLNQENIQRSKLRVDTRKWLMSKLQPTKYGDRIDVTSDGKALPTPLLAGLVDAANTTDDINVDVQ